MLFWRIFDRIEEGLALIALAGVVLSVFVAAVGRSFGAPVMSAPQYAQLALIWSVMLGADVAARQGVHIRVNAVFDALPAAGRAVVSLFFLALILPFLGFVAWYGWFLAMGNWQRELGASGLSYGLVTLALPVGAVLIAISFLRRLFSLGLTGVFDHLAEPDPTPDAVKTSEEEIL